MAKIRKQQRRKKYNYNVNRKRLRNKIRSNGNISCKSIKEAWVFGKSARTNLTEMGLAHDPNLTIKIKTATSEWTEKKCKEKVAPTKVFVADALEKEAKAPRERRFQLPKSQIEWVSYLIDTYGSDYRAMVRDKKNYNQETWKQLRAKIRLFKGIAEQYSKYLSDRNLNPQDVKDDPLLSDDEL